MATNDIGVRVKLEGEQQYKEQMRQITQQTKLMRAETAKMEAEWNKDSTAQQKAAQQTKLLKTQIDQQKKTVETARANVQKYSEATGENSAQTLKWKTALAEAEAELKRLENELAQVPNKAQLIGKAMQDAGQKIEAVGKKISSVGSGMTKGVTAPIVAAAAAAVKVTADFDTSMSKVRALSGATAEEFEQLRNKAREMGASTKYSAGEAADALSYMALAGWDTQQMIGGLDGVLNLAAASGMDLAQASDLVTDYLSAFGLQASDASRMADELAYAQANSNTTTQQLGDAFGNTAAQMHTAGQSMETTTAILEAFANQGLKGSEAGTALSAMVRDITQHMEDGAIKIGETTIQVQDANGNFRNMIDILADVEEATDGMGSAEKSAALMTTFTARSVKGVSMALTEGTDNIRGYEDELTNAGGTAKQMAEVMQDNLTGQLTILKSQVQELGISFGDILVPKIRKAVDWVQKQVDKFNKLDSSTKENIVKFGMLAAAAGPVLLVTGKMVESVGKLVSTGGKVIEWVGKMAAGHAANATAAAADATATTAAATATEGLNAAMAVSPVGAVALAIGALVAGILALKAGYEHAKQAALEENEALNETVTATKNATSGLQDAGNALKETYDEADQSIAQVMASSQRATTIADELADLQKKTKLTTDEQQRMKALVGELNGLYPDLGLAIDDNTGKLNKNADEIQNVVQQATNMAKVQAYQKAIAAITEELGAAYEAQALAAWEADRAQEAAAEANKGREADIARLQERIKSATGTEKELLQAQLDSLQAQGGQSLAVREANDALTQYNNTERETTRTIEEGNDKIDYLTKAMNEAAAEIGLTDEEIAGIGESTEEAADATEELALETEDLGDTMEETAETISDASKEIIDAYNSTKDSAYTSTMEQKGLFEELEAAEAVSIESMISGLQSHIEAYSNWNGNVDKLMSDTRYKTDEGFRNMVNSITAAGIDMAPELQAIVTAFENGDAQIEQLVDGYGNMKQLSVEASENMAFAKTELQYGIGGMAEAFAEGGITLEGAAGEMIASASAPINRGDLQKAALDEARFAVDGMSTTLDSGEPSAAMTSALARMEKENSKPATAAGENIAGNVGAGMTDGSGEIAAGGDAMSSEVQSTLTEVGAQASQAQSDGSEIAKAMAQGINGSKPLVIAAMNAVKTAISTSLLQIRGLSSTAKTNGQGISNSLRDGINAGKSGVQTAMDGLKTTVTTALDGISSSSGTAKTAGQNIASNLAAGINAKAGDVSTAATTLASKASEPISGLQDKSWKWGNDFGKNFNNGLAASQDAIVKTATAIAQAVKDALGHSTPKVGPMKDDDVWGLHMGQNFAAGMVKSIPAIEAASYQMASAAVLDTYADIGMLSGQSEPLTADMMFDAFSAALKEADMNVYIGNREFRRVLRENGAIA